MGLSERPPRSDPERKSPGAERNSVQQTERAMARKWVSGRRSGLMVPPVTVSSGLGGGIGPR